MKKEYIKPEYIEVDIDAQEIMAASNLDKSDEVGGVDDDKSRERDTNGLFDW